MSRAVFFATTLLAVNVYAQTRDTPVVMGNLGVHYNSFNTVISTDDHPLTASPSGPIWCQATLNEFPLPIMSSNFLRYGDPQRRRFVPYVNHTSQRASLNVGETVIDNMGKYRCEIQIMDNKENERTVFGHLMVYSSPFFHTDGSMNLVASEHNKHEVAADQLHATEGARMEIHCPAVGYPKPTIHWYKDSELLALSDRVFLSNNGTLLTIDKLSTEDEAEYMCTATNEYPNRLDVEWKKHEVSLKQVVRISHYKPAVMGNLGVHYHSFKTIISTDEHPLTAALTGPIWCQATLNEVPLPIIKSTFIRYIDPQRRRFVPYINHNSHKASLDVGETVIDNMGKYRCEIEIMENEESEQTVFGNLMVYSSPFFHTDGSMNMVSNEQNKHEVKADRLYATEGARMEIHCPAVGYPKPTIHWYKNSMLLALSDRIFLSNNGTLLTIEKFSSDDEAEYTCTAINEYPYRLDVDWKKHKVSLKQKVSIRTPPNSWESSWMCLMFDCSGAFESDSSTPCDIRRRVLRGCNKEAIQKMDAYKPRDLLKPEPEDGNTGRGDDENQLLDFF